MSDLVRSAHAVEFPRREADTFRLSRNLAGEERRRWLLNACAMMGAFLLLMPKIVILAIGGETAGIRLDDVAIALMSFVLLTFPYRRVAAFRPVIQALALLVVLGLISNVNNILLFQRSSFLYSLRYIEYFIYAPLGYWYARRHSLTKLALVIGGLNGVVMILQMLHLMVGFTTKDGTVTGGLAYRPIGLTSGAYEVGALLNFCAAILIADRTISVKMKYVYTTVSLVLIVFTGARMPLGAGLFLFAALAMRNGITVGRVLLASFLVALVFLGLALAPNTASDRSSATFKASSITTFAERYAAASPTVDGPFDFDTVSFDEDTDASWEVRCIKWSEVIKTWLNQWSSWFIGLGPGACGLALDGGWLRILMEDGVIGLALYIFLLRKLSGVSKGMKLVGICLAINMLMIDIYLSSKAMSWFFFYFGGVVAMNQMRSQWTGRTVLHQNPS